MTQSPTAARTAQPEPHPARQKPTNPVRALQTFGQSVWLDHLRRSLFTSGEFNRLIDEDGLRGVTSNPSIFEKAHRGAGFRRPRAQRAFRLILIATGSEVSIALQAHGVLTTDGIPSRVVSMPSWELFERQPPAYREAVLPSSVRARVSIEAASPFGWERYVGSEGAILGTAHFGASAPGPVVMREFGFTAEHIVETAKALLNTDERTVSQ